MRNRKRLSRSPHPRSVFARTIPPTIVEPPTSRSSSKRRSRPSQPRMFDADRGSKHRARAARVRIGKETVLVVEVKAELVTDMFEAQVALTAIELTCGQPAVLWAYEPCGCRELFGRREHIWHIDGLSSESLEWARIEIDFARPASPRERLN